MVFTLYIRPTGIVLLCAIVGFFFIHRRWHQGVIFGLVSLVSITPLFVRNYLVAGSPTTYIMQLQNSYKALSLKSMVSGAVHIINQMLFYLKAVVIDTLFRIPGNPSSGIIFVVSALIVVLVLTGLVISYDSSYVKIWKYYVIGFSILHIIWPLKAIRYFYPIIPFIAFFFILGLKHVLAKFNISYKILLLPCIISFMCSMSPNIRIWKSSLLKNNPLSSPPVKTFEWISKNTSPYAVIACQSGGTVYLYTERKTVEIFPSLQNLRKIQGKIRYYLLGVDQMVLNRTPVYNTQEYNKILQRYIIPYKCPEESTYVLDLNNVITP